MKNERAAAQGLPAWLNGQTVAIIGTMFTIGIGLGGMNLTSRAHMDTRIGDLSARIDGLSARVDGLDHRLRAVEVGVAEIRGRLGLPSAFRPEDPKTGTEPPDAAQGAVPQSPR